MSADELQTDEATTAVSPFSPVRAAPVTEVVAQHLRKAILSGHLKPGQRLVEQKLATTFGIGQPTLREALKDLEYQGFVRKLQNKGTYVTQLSASDMRDMHEVRMALETLAIEKAAAALTDGSLEALAAQLQRMREAADAGDLAEFHASDMAFHHVIWGLSGNTYLSSSLDRISASLFAFVLLGGKGHEHNYSAAVSQHEEILAGLATRDPEQARARFHEITLTYWTRHRNVELK